MRFSFFLPLILGFSRTFAWSEEDQETIDTFIQNTFLPTHRTPGLILTIIENDAVVVAKGYGYKNIEQSLAADGETLMAIGSVSKSLVATLIAKTLHETFPELGAEVLNVPVQTFFSNTNITFIDRYRSESMSFRDLLSHRSCLYTPGYDLLFNTVTSIEERKYRTRYLKEKCGFRAGYEYNNALYGLAAELLGDIVGTPFRELLVTFMEEIGMESGTYMDIDGQFENLEHMSSAYYVRDNVTELFNPRLLRRVDPVLGAGGILASAEDMGAYMKLHLNRGRVGERQVIPEYVFDWIYQIATGINSFMAGKVPSVSDTVVGHYGYSLGWVHNVINGYVEITHNGYWPPFFTELHMFPELKHGVFISLNGPGSMPAYSEISPANLAYRILSILQGVSPFSPLSNPSPNLDKQWSGFQQPLMSNREVPGLTKPKKRELKRVEDLIGSYGHPSEGDLIIQLDPDVGDGETLEIRFGEYGIGRLRPLEEEPLLFAVVEWKTDIVQNLYTDCTSFDCVLPEDIIDMRFANSVILGEEVFIKDENLETYPPIPWSPGSCAPVTPPLHNEL